MNDTDRPLIEKPSRDLKAAYARHACSPRGGRRRAIERGARKLGTGGGKKLDGPRAPGFALRRASTDIVWALDRPASAGAGMEPFRRVLTYAFRAGASGYLAGRAIWWEAFEVYPDMARFEASLAEGGVAYMHRINALLAQHGTPWTRRPAFRAGLAIAPGGEEFVRRYP